MKFTCKGYEQKIFLWLEQVESSVILMGYDEAGIRKSILSLKDGGLFLHDGANLNGLKCDFRGRVLIKEN